MQPPLWPQLLLQVILIAINAYFAATEIAVISLNEAVIRHQAEEGDKKAVRLLAIVETPTRFLSTIQIGITLAGFLENVREVGQNFAFAVLRDFYGVTQVVVENEAMWKAFKGLNKESTVQITGVVRERDSKNPKLPTGDIEVVPEAVEVLGRCRHNELPFQICLLYTSDAADE